MSISRFVRTSALMMMAVLIVGGLLAAWRLDRIRIGGAVQLEQQRTEELIADILPPPAYVIEPYLETTLLLRGGGDSEAHYRNLAALKRAYDARIGYWRQSSIDPGLRALLLESTEPPARRFWGEVEQRFLPALRRGDKQGAEASYARIVKAYHAHRAAVDKLVAAAGAHRQSVTEGAGSELLLAVAIVLVLALIVAAQAARFYYVMHRRVIRPVEALSTATARFARGEDGETPYCAHDDEVGQIARGIEHFRSSAAARAAHDADRLATQQTVTEALCEGLIALREGDLTRFVTAEFPGDFRALQERINEAVDAMRDKIQRVSDSAVSISENAQEVASVSNDLARRTETTATSVAQAASALQQVDSRLQANTDAADRTVLSADEARQAVDNGRATASRAVEAMTRVSDSARSIDDVIEGLDKIAFQTRVLAMNAAVEAGRAGEAGRGFAVVADLVSALAMRAEEESKRARELLTTTQDDIAQANSQVAETDGALIAISAAVSEVHALLGRMREENRAQASAVKEVAGAMRAMDTMTQQNAAIVEETSAATSKLSAEVGALARSAGEFRLTSDAAAPAPSRRTHGATVH